MTLVKQPIHTHSIEYHNMASYLIRNISNKNYDAANEILSEHVSIIMEKKLFELKKNMAAKMCEQMGFMGPSRAEKLRTGVLEEDELDEAIDPKEDSMSVERGIPQQPKNTTVVPKNNMGGPGSTHNKNMKEQAAGGSGLIVPKSNTREKGDLPSSVTIDKISPEKQSAIDIISKNTKALIDLKNKGKYKGPIDQAIEEETEKQLDEAQGTYRAGYKYDPVVKTSNSKGTSWSQTATKGIDNKPDYAGKQQELRSLDNTQSSDGRTSSSMHDVVKSKIVRPDKNDGRGGDYDVSTSTNVTQRSVQEETEEQLDEARVKIVKARIRGGKIQRRKKVSNVEGYKVQGGQLKRMSPTERRHRKLGQKRGKIKRRSKMTRTLMKRQKSIRKRQSLGI